MVGPWQVAGATAAVPNSASNVHTGEAMALVRRYARWRYWICPSLRGRMAVAEA